MGCTARIRNLQLRPASEQKTATVKQLLNMAIAASQHLAKSLIQDFQPNKSRTRGTINMFACIPAATYYKNLVCNTQHAAEQKQIQVHVRRNNMLCHSPGMRKPHMQKHINKYGKRYKKDQCPLSVKQMIRKCTPKK